MAENSGLSINIEVIENMAAMAAAEVSGVAQLSPRKVDIKKAVSGKSILKPVHAEIRNGAVIINVYICVEHNANAKQVAEAVQEGVKEKVQNMSGNAVTKVNVTVADIKLEQAEETE